MGTLSPSSNGWPLFLIKFSFSLSGCRFRVDRQKLWERKPSEWHSHRKGVGVGSCVCETKRVVESCGGILKDDNVLIGS